MRAAFWLKQLFYRANLPWARVQLFEHLGSRRFSQPAPPDIGKRLEELLPSGAGTFVEAGAHDGFTHSNTYYLERFEGWHGVLVEAVPELARKAERRRPRSTVVEAALVAPEQEGESITFQFGDLTTTVGSPEYASIGLDNAGMQGYEFRAEGRCLSSILDETGLGAPSLLVLDLEGHELEALAGLDLARHAPSYLMIEIVEMHCQRPSFDAALGARYEFVEAITPSDAIYRLKQ